MATKELNYFLLHSAQEGKTEKQRLFSYNKTDEKNYQSKKR